MFDKISTTEEMNWIRALSNIGRRNKITHQFRVKLWKWDIPGEFLRCLFRSVIFDKKVDRSPPRLPPSSHSSNFWINSFWQKNTNRWKHHKQNYIRCFWKKKIIIINHNNNSNNWTYLRRDEQNGGGERVGLHGRITCSEGPGRSKAGNDVVRFPNCQQQLGWGTWLVMRMIMIGGGGPLVVIWIPGINSFTRISKFTRISQIHPLPILL